MLHKTIVFITHDFDEAIRLADRIAIMKDGAIIQIGTPEELVTRPATDYVAEFTRDVPRAKVLSARSVMSPKPRLRRRTRTLCRHRIRRGAQAEDLAPALVDGRAPLCRDRRIKPDG